MPIKWTERKCGHVSTTHDSATAVRTALYKMRRDSQYRRASATECLNSSIQTACGSRYREVLYAAKNTPLKNLCQLLINVRDLWDARISARMWVSPRSSGARSINPFGGGRWWLRRMRADGRPHALRLIQKCRRHREGAAIG